MTQKTQTAWTEEKWTVRLRPGGTLTGADAEIAEIEGCEPFAYSQAIIEREGEVNPVAEITWDARTPGRTEQCEARARLIAAAPEMAELLENIGDPNRSVYDHMNDIADSRALLTRLKADQ